MNSPARSPSIPFGQPDARHFSISSRWLYDGDSRLDATTYAEAGFRILGELASCPFPASTVGELCGTIWHPVQNQARSNFKRIYTAAAHGVPFVSSRTMLFFPLRPERFLSRHMEKLGDLMVPEGWLLLSRSGTVGNILYVSQDLARCAISDHAIRIEPKNVLAGYLYAFLVSRYGRALISKDTYGATVEELEPKHLARIPVPILPESERAAIHGEIVRAYALRDQANHLLKRAEEELHALLGMPPFLDEDIDYLGKGSDPRAFAVSSSQLSDRLDATHHVPVARSAVRKLKAGRFPLVPLGDRIDRVYVAPRFARIYVDEDFGTPLLQGSHIPMIRPIGLKCISTTKTERIERWIIRAGWVLVTCSGTIGRVAVATEGQDGWAASQHILRIIPRPNVSHAGFIAAFLGTPFGQHQLKAKIYGGVVDELTEEDTAAVYLPDVPFEEQERIGAEVVRAYEMRDEANAGEARAVEQLERLIRPG